MVIKKRTVKEGEFKIIFKAKMQKRKKENIGTQMIGNKQNNKAN